MNVPFVQNLRQEKARWRRRVPGRKVRIIVQHGLDVPLRQIAPAHLDENPGHPPNHFPEKMRPRHGQDDAVADFFKTDVIDENLG